MIGFYGKGAEHIFAALFKFGVGAQLCEKLAAVAAATGGRTRGRRRRARRAADGARRQPRGRGSDGKRARVEPETTEKRNGKGTPCFPTSIFKIVNYSFNKFDPLST